jgi:hypothetical protein
MRDLADEMTRLVERARTLIPLSPSSGDVHRQVCVALADEFDLWRPDETGISAFPVWLSRVVEGEMRDAE